MADSSHAAKTLVIKAEDARILGDIAAVRSCYAQLYTLNADAIPDTDPSLPPPKWGPSPRTSTQNPNAAPPLKP